MDLFTYALHLSACMGRVKQAFQALFCASDIGEITLIQRES